jgi:hypothetical protein
MLIKSNKAIKLQFFDSEKRNQMIIMRHEIIGMSILSNTQILRLKTARKRSNVEDERKNSQDNSLRF